MTRVCPHCGSSERTLAMLMDIVGQVEYAYAGCRDCDTIWKERHFKREGRTEQYEIELFNGGPKEIVVPDFGPAPTPAQQPVSYSHADGCPMCMSGHIHLQVQGRGSAACRCTMCGATWDYFYDAEKEEVTRTNIKPGETMPR